MSLFKRCAHKGRQRDHCDHPWWSVIRVRHQRVQTSLEKYYRRSIRGKGSKTLAKDCERQLHDDIKSGAYFERERQTAELQIPKDGITVEAFATIYTEKYIEFKGLRTADARGYQLALLVDRWKGMRLADVKLRHIDAVLADVKAGQWGHTSKKPRKPSTVGGVFALIRHMLRWAESRGYIETLPFKRGQIELEATNNERTRRVTPAEEQALFEHATPYLADYMTVALHTGLRKGAIRGLTVGHIDFTPGRLDGGEVGHYGLIALSRQLMKSKRLHVLPMTKACRDVLWRRAEAVNQRAESALFGATDGRVYTSHTRVQRDWEAALKGAGIKVPADHAHQVEAVDKDLEFRDLRAEAASRLAEMGVPLDAIRRFLDHSSLAMTQRYLRAKVAETHDTVAALTGYLPMIERRSKLRLVTGNNVDETVDAESKKRDKTA